MDVDELFGTIGATPQKLALHRYDMLRHGDLVEDNRLPDGMGKIKEILSCERLPDGKLHGVYLVQPC